MARMEGGGAIYMEVDTLRPGDVSVATPVGNFTVPYSSTGRFSAFGGAQNSR
jgi:hypothetical protein